MSILQAIQWPRSAFDEKEIKNQPTEFYLQILHFLFTDYSQEFYKSVLNIVPNIKTLSDLKFA